jgi:hypothetical protein
VVSSVLGSQFKQFNPSGKYNTDIEQRLYMEYHDLVDAGLPDDDVNLIQLIMDARMWIRQAKSIYHIPNNWQIPEEE